MVAADAIYGATINLLNQVFEPFGVAVHFVDICDLDAVASAIAEHKPGLRPDGDDLEPAAPRGRNRRDCELARAAGAALIVDNTFATPLLVRPLELGAHIVGP